MKEGESDLPPESWVAGRTAGSVSHGEVGEDIEVWGVNGPWPSGVRGEDFFTSLSKLKELRSRLGTVECLLDILKRTALARFLPLCGYGVVERECWAAQ